LKNKKETRSLKKQAVEEINYSIPNRITIEAIEELNSDTELITYKNIEDFWESLGS
jgi:hypothetical protein